MINRLKTLSPQFKQVLRLSSRLARESGFDIYLVGGVARDLILKKKIFDLDIVVQGGAIALAQKLAKKLGAGFKKHQSFGTARVDFCGKRIDFATARTEKYSYPGALPKVKPSTIKEDLGRRDFTVNTIAISLNKNNYGELVDLYSGLSDLKKGLIRILHRNSFFDDPTRILRAIRFKERFNFSFEPKTKKLIKQAIAKKALRSISLHRLREELTLILSEARPYKCIKRIDKLLGFSFIDKKLRLEKKDCQLILRIQRALLHYEKKLKKIRSLQVWLLYLAAILIKISDKKLQKVLLDFGFRRGEKIIITSIKEGLYLIKKLKKVKTYAAVYKILESYSFESMMFFYAYHPDRLLRKKIEHFFDQLAAVRLMISGGDLKSLGFAPDKLYTKVLEKTLHAKLNRGFKTKKEEIEEAKKIFKQFKSKR